MADGKWMRDLRHDLPLADAARRVLAARLAVVAAYLPKATLHAGDDDEYVHQLRVGTRRGDAALRLFRGCLPKRAYKAARQRLRAVRRAAGAARDWDVFLADLRQRAERASPDDRPGLDLLVGYALGQRHAAQAGLESAETGQTVPFDDFAADAVAAVRPPVRASATLIDLARPVLASLAEALRRTASGDLDDYDRLHQVRIAGKRLRYAMEVFAECFAPPFREAVYPRVEQMQETLGRANDSHVAAGRLEALAEQLRAFPETWGRVGPGVEALARWHRERLPAEREAFLRWWQAWRHDGEAGLLGAAEVVRSRSD